MRSVRLLVIVLALLTGAGHALLDSCVFGCRSHVHAAVPETPACHGEGQHEASTNTEGDRWTTTAACAHDHAAISADVVSQPRPGRSDGTPDAAHVPVVAIAAAVQPIPVRAEFDPVVSRSPRSGAFLSPLRL